VFPRSYKCACSTQLKTSKEKEKNILREKQMKQKWKNKKEIPM
jgi:hypothetical protein